MSTHRLDRMISSCIELLDIVGSNAMLLQDVKGLVGDGDLMMDDEEKKIMVSSNFSA